MFDLADERSAILLWTPGRNVKMKFAICIAVIFCVSLVGCSPVTSSRDKLNVTDEFFLEEFVIYTADHEIVSLLTPLNALNYDDDNDDKYDEEESAGSTLFFALADIGPNGEKVDKGLYVSKKGAVTKLLENGRDSTAELGNSKVVYFGASDGLYKYNNVENKAEKYGTVTDSIIQLVKVNSSDTIYILTEDRQLYKVTEAGTKKTKVDGVINPKEIALDFGDNLYYIGDNNKPYVIAADGVKEITGLPENPNYTKLVRPPFILENGVVFVSGDKAYAIYATGTSEFMDVVLQAKPSAYAIEGTLLQYYAYNKKIYEYNILTIIVGSILEEMKSFLQNYASDIQKIATRSRSDLRA